MTTCPCGNPLAYEECCGQYIDSGMLPAHPEILMRSRYTAFVLRKLQYLADTMKANAARAFDFDGLESWLAKIEWQGLTVIKSRLTSPSHGFVSFEARYLEADKVHVLREKSEFRKINGKWFYVDGQLLKVKK